MTRMSYLVLARKYRPRDFGELAGQEHVVQALSNALTQQRLHHAYLFTGTRGVGKTTVSRILAKSLNCTGRDGQGGITAAPCGVCAACTDIDAGRFVDYVELDAASNRGVEEISQLLDQAVYKPVVGRFKVYMIDEVHMLSNTAFNAMLKTLEEPPEYLKFVLATTDPQKVPVTVLSRCLQFNLRPMAVETVQEHLGRVLASESIPADAGSLRLIARAARGSMRDALSLADQAIAYGAGRLDEATVRQMLGAVDRSHAVRIATALAGGDGAALVAAVDGVRGLGLSATGTLDEVALLAQQAALLQVVPDALDPADGGAADARRLAAQLPAEDLQLLYSIALHGREELALAPDEYAGLLMVLLRVLAFRLPGGERSVAPEGAAARAGSAAPAAAAAASTGSPAPALARGSAPLSKPSASTAVAAAAPSRAVVPKVPAARPDLQPPPWLDEPPPIDAEAAADVADAAQGHSPSQPPGGSAAVPVDEAVGEPELQRTELGDRWVGWVSKLEARGGFVALVRELALQGQCVAVDDASAPLRVRLRVERESLRADALRDKLASLLADALASPVVLETEPGVPMDSVALRDMAERRLRQREAERIILDDPLVQEMMRQFKTARIVPGSIKPH
jgi:DNA polymerase-3 subunit gamma/tau